MPRGLNDVRRETHLTCTLKYSIQGHILIPKYTLFFDYFEGAKKNADTPSYTPWRIALPLLQGLI